MFDGSSLDTMAAFKTALHKSGFSPTLRLIRGRDIAAACGQLAATSEVPVSH